MGKAKKETVSESVKRRFLVIGTSVFQSAKAFLGLWALSPILEVMLTILVL